MIRGLQDGEREWLAAVVTDLRDDAPKLVYADWLEEHGDARRARFLRLFVEAARSMDPDAFPKARGLPEEWLELIGFRLVERIADDEERHPELLVRVLRLARPALRMKKGGRSVPAGASKIGGLPDLPPGFPWPLGRDCRAIYNDDTAGEERLAGFLAQIDLAEGSRSPGKSRWHNSPGRSPVNSNVRNTGNCQPSHTSRNARSCAASRSVIGRARSTGMRSMPSAAKGFSA